MTDKLDQLAEEEEKKSRPGLRLALGIGCFVLVIAGLLLSGLFSHRDEGGVKILESRDALVQALMGLPDAAVPQLPPEAREVQWTLLQGHGAAAGPVGWDILWKAPAGATEGKYEIRCDQSNEKTGAHQLYHGVLYEDSAYEKQQEGDWPVRYRFTLGKQVYTLRGRWDAGLAEAERPAAREAVAGQLRALLEQIIDGRPAA